FTRVLLVLAGLCLVAGAATAALSAWTLYSNLMAEYESKAQAIAETIAESSADDLLYSDPSSVQAMIDQYAETKGVAYIFVIDGKGEIVSHTFAPRVPAQVIGLKDDPKATTVRSLAVDGVGDCLDVSAPIAAGQVGYVHVGMKLAGVRETVWAATLR